MSIYNLSVSPQLASLSNPNGLVSVAGEVYNVFDEKQLVELEALL